MEDSGIVAVAERSRVMDLAEEGKDNRRNLTDDCRTMK